MLPGNVLVRTGEPSKYDQSPYGTLCKKVKMMSDVFEMYIQMNKDDCNPRWEKVGIFSPETENLAIVEVNRILNIKKIV